MKESEAKSIRFLYWIHGKQNNPVLCKTGPAMKNADTKGFYPRFNRAISDRKTTSFQLSF
jgi:hypothetical protein